MAAEEKRDIKRKLNLIGHAKEIGNVKKACRYFGISRSTYYVWVERYEKSGEKGLINSKWLLRINYRFVYFETG